MKPVRQAQFGRKPAGRGERGELAQVEAAIKVGVCREEGGKTGCIGWRGAGMMQFSFQDAIRSVQLVRPVPGAFSCPSVDCRVAQRRSELWIDHLVRMSQPFSQTVTHQLQRVSLTVSSGTPPLVYRSAEALATDGGLVVAKDLPDSAGGVKTFGQQEGSKEEEEASDPVNGILEIVDPAGGQRVRWRRTRLLFRHTSAP